MYRTQSIVSFFLLALLSACSADSGTSSLVVATEEPSGDNCADGGVKLEVGQDDNGNGVLDQEEVATTSYVCGTAGQSGEASLVSTSDEQPGANCPEGGLRVDTGIDDNDNGVLDPSEVDASEYLCQESGVSTLVSTAEEAPGANCTLGGTRISSGPDTNGNGTLEAEEVVAATFLCRDAQQAVLINPEAAGSNCALGGTRIDTGLDVDGDGLEPGEITTTDFVCNGAGVLVADTFVNVFDPSLHGFADFQRKALLSTTINAPTAGTVIAIGRADVFCSSNPNDVSFLCGGGDPASDVCLGISPNSDEVICPSFFPPPFAATFAFLTPNTTESMTTMRTFEVEAGVNTLFLIGSTMSNSLFGGAGYFRPQLTLIFTPAP